MTSYPVLIMIDRWNGGGSDGPLLSIRADAARLELLARRLAEAHWSEHVWLTGQVSEAAFRAVYDALLDAVTPDESKRRLTVVEPPERGKALPPPVARYPVGQWRVAG